MSAQLKRCPFCGGGARPVKHEAGVRGTMAFDRWDGVACQSCGAGIGFSDRRFRSTDEAGKPWQRARGMPSCVYLPWRMLPLA